MGRYGGGLGTYTDQDTLVLEVAVGDGELVGERHFVWESVMSVEYRSWRVIGITSMEYEEEDRKLGERGC
jgi:hypothetical protein